MKRRIVSVIGPNASGCSEAVYQFGLELGSLLCNAGWTLVCGGMQGLMEAVCRGARHSDRYSWGASVGIIPGDDPSEANPWCDIVIPTGIGVARNKMVVGAGEAVIAVAGGAGTLSEIAMAWQMDKPVLCVTSLGGWSEKLAGTDLDQRKTGLLVKAKRMDEINAWLHER